MGRRKGLAQPRARHRRLSDTRERSQGRAAITPEEWRDVKAVFQRALELSLTDRHVYLAAQSDTVRSEVESLLRAYEHGSPFPATSCPDASASPSRGDEPDLVGRHFGPYRVLSLLGEGGMGTVWLAERVDGLFTRRVALKLVHPVLMGRSMSERVAREREILASLNHPHIAQLFDAGFAEDGQPYLALEYVEGMPLTTYCDDHHRGVSERLVLFRQVLAAVQYAHAHLVIHRDLKPSNILVSEDGQIHLLDFGIAKLLTPGATKETQLTQIAGRALTPDYAAPEQITGAGSSTAADVYALGVILYELLSGERPYRLTRPSRGALEEAILQAEPLAPSRQALTQGAAQARASSPQKLARALQGDLDTIIGKALKKSPSERYSSVSAFDADIARFLSGEVVLAQPDSAIYRARKFVSRHRVGIAAVALLVLTLAAGLTATTYEAYVASRQRDAAIEAQRRALTQAAAGRLRGNDVPGALGIITQMLAQRGTTRPYPADALSVFQEARAADAQQLMALVGHTDLLAGAAFSPDGRRIVTAAFDKTARIWDAATGQQLTVLSGHGKGVRSAAFSPDGLRIVTASLDNSARVWDAVSGQSLLTLTGHTDRVNSAAYSPDGRHIVTASHDKTARVWDAASGSELLTLSGHTTYVRGATFSPDGRQIVTAAEDSTARVWETATGRLLRVLTGHTAAVEVAAFSPDGRWIVTASQDRTARLWSATSGEQRDVLTGHTAYVAGVAFSPDGLRIVTASGDKTVRLWDTASGEQLRVLSGHGAYVFSVAFSPDGRHLVSTSFDKTARVWDLGNALELMVLRGHWGVVSAEFSRDGQRIATTDGATARLWDAATGQELRVLSGHTAGVSDVAFSPDGRRLVTSSGDRTARLWDAVSGEPLSVLSGHTDRVMRAAFSPDGREIATGSLDTTARLWDAATGEQQRVLSGHAMELTTVAFSTDGRHVLTSSLDKSARLWDAASGRQLLVVQAESALYRSALSPDGRLIVAPADDKSARIWNAVSGELRLTLSGHSEPLTSSAFSPDGRRIVTTSADRTARLWDAATGEQLQVLSGHTGTVIRAAFSPDGQRILTGSVDTTARVWDARTVPLETQLAVVEAAQFDELSPTERSQLGLSEPSDVRRWPADASKCDRVAAAPYDPARRAAGVVLAHIVPDLALPTCTEAQGSASARVIYQHGRALLASGDLTAARQDFDHAIALGYSTAQIDLGDLLTRPSARVPDAQRAVALFERAWSEGVTIAAFELGALYERGLRPAASSGRPFATEESRAWSWYQKGADAGEPNALARLALREDRAALAAANAADRDKHLLYAFQLYAAAAERARLEDWSDDAWRSWRYRRASLARLLARAGMTQEVANTYKSVRKKYARRSSL